MIRRAAGGKTAPQVLAANVDLALVAEPLPDPNARRMERLVALAAAGDVRAALVLTKADMDPEAHTTCARLARSLGLADAVAVSVRGGDGLAVLRALLVPGSTALAVSVDPGVDTPSSARRFLTEQRAIGRIDFVLATGDSSPPSGRALPSSLRPTSSSTKPGSSSSTPAAFSVLATPSTTRRPKALPATHCFLRAGAANEPHSEPLRGAHCVRAPGR